MRKYSTITKLDDDICLDVDSLNFNTMNQHIQQTAVQRAMHPVARQIKTGLEQWDIYDTDETIQQQADDNAAELEELHLTKKRQGIDRCLYT